MKHYREREIVYFSSKRRTVKAIRMIGMILGIREEPQ